MPIVYVLLAILSCNPLQAFTKKYGPPPNEDVIKRIQAYLPTNPIIVEGGTYDGTDSVELSNLLPQATIYTFEPVPELFKRSCQRTKNYSNIRVYNSALSDKVGAATIYLSEERDKPNVVSMSSSLLAPKDHLIYSATLFKNTTQIATTTLDEWALSNNVSHIDFLKLDIQGYELNVLKASPRLVSTVKATLLEVEFVEAYKGQYLYEDIKQWLEDKGFVLDCLYLNGWFGDALFIRK